MLSAHCEMFRSTDCYSDFALIEAKCIRAEGVLGIRTMTVHHCRTEDGGRTERAEASRPARKYSETPDSELVAGRALRDRQGDPGQQVG